jgi:cyclophilin family peptidyl-prolyl cis-trans isomerase
MRTTFFLLLMIILLSNCSTTEKKEEITKETTQQKIDTAKAKKNLELLKEEKVEKPWDSLNKNNFEAFFTEFGKQNKEDKVVIKTKFGNITLRLYEDTPIHRANFIFLTKIEYFNTTEFYRVAKGFVIQGGNSDEYEMIKKRMKYDNYLLKPEFRKNRKHKYGALAAAREWDDNPEKLSSPFQFYIVTKKDGAYHLDGEHTVFGEVIAGFEAMHKMEQVKVDPGQWPIQNVNMTVEIVKK